MTRGGGGKTATSALEPPAYLRVAVFDDMKIKELVVVLPAEE